MDNSLYSPTNSFVVTEQYIYCLCYDHYVRKYCKKTWACVKPYKIMGIERLKILNNTIYGYGNVLIDIDSDKPGIYSNKFIENIWWWKGCLYFSNGEGLYKVCNNNPCKVLNGDYFQLYEDYIVCINKKIIRIYKDNIEDNLVEIQIDLDKYRFSTMNLGEKILINSLDSVYCLDIKRYSIEKINFKYFSDNYMIVEDFIFVLLRSENKVLVVDKYSLDCLQVLEYDNIDIISFYVYKDLIYISKSFEILTIENEWYTLMRRRELIVENLYQIFDKDINSIITPYIL